MNEYTTISANDRRFQERYGLTPEQVMQAVDENRKQIARRLSEWGFTWAIDEIMANILDDLLQGGLDRWHDSPPDRQAPLGAFVNKIAFDKLGAWMDKERPKYRGGMTYAPRQHRNHDTTNLDGGDADQIRAWIRAESRAASGDRLCESGDVFADTGDAIVSAPAGDKASYRAWLTQEDEDACACDQYATDLKALESLIHGTYGLHVWITLLRRCMTDHKPKGDGLRREVRHWLEAHHTGDANTLTSYPYIAQIINKDQI